MKTEEWIAAHPEALVGTFDVLVKHLDPETSREAYCSCGHPIGEYGHEWPMHLVEVMWDQVLATGALVPKESQS